MAVTEYIGPLVGPVFADPPEWTPTRSYEALTIVLNEGNSYTARQDVPIGVQITNEKYWLKTGNYNAQVEQYRQEVRTILPLDNTPTDGSTKGVTSDGIKKAISAETARAEAAEEAASKAVADEATRAIAADKTNADAISAETTRATAAEKTNADAISAETTRAKEAEAAITAAYQAADSTLAAHFPIRAADIVAGAITKDKLDADALSSLVKGITIRTFDSANSKADNAGLVVPQNIGCRLAGYYLPELTLLVITHFESSIGQVVGAFNDAAYPGDKAVEYKLPDYVPHTYDNLFLNAVGICYTSSSPLVSWTGIGLTRDGHVGVNTKIRSTDNKAISMAGNAAVFLRAFGVEE